MSDVELTAVREAHRFDETKLNAFLEEQIPDYGGPLEVRQFEGGQSNPTFQLITPKKTKTPIQNKETIIFNKTGLEFIIYFESFV